MFIGGVKGRVPALERSAVPKRAEAIVLRYKTHRDTCGILICSDLIRGNFLTIPNPTSGTLKLFDNIFLIV